MGSRRRRVLGLWRPSGARFPLISAHLHFHPSPKGARPNPCGTTPLSPPPRGRLRRSQGPGRVASLSDPRALKSARSNRDLRIADLRRVTAEARAARVWRRVNPPIERVDTSWRYARHRNRGVFTRSIAAGATRAPARRRYPSVASPEPCGCRSSRLDRSVADRHPARSRIITQLRWLPRTVPPSSSPPSLSTRVTPTSSRTRYAPRRPVSGRPPPSPLQTEQRSFFPPSRPRMEIWGCGASGRKRRRRRTSGASNVHFEPALTSHLPHVVHTADLRCRSRRVPRRGPRLQGATTDRHRPFWQKPKTKNQKPKDYQINGSTRI